ncbi:MAG: hypothetical protein ACP5DZ_09615 [Bacteroidales bacterium]
MKKQAPKSSKTRHSKVIAHCIPLVKLITMKIDIGKEITNNINLALTSVLSPINK